MVSWPSRAGPPRMARAPSRATSSSRAQADPVVRLGQPGSLHGRGYSPAAAAGPSSRSWLARFKMVRRFRVEAS